MMFRISFVLLLALKKVTQSCRIQLPFHLLILSQHCWI